MLKKGEADFAAAMQGEIAEDVKRDPKLALVDTRHASMFWLEFPEQWEPKSPWADKRVRLAVNYALDRQAINEASCLGFCPPAGVIVPRVMDFALQTEPIPTIRRKPSNSWPRPAIAMALTRATSHPTRDFQSSRKRWSIT